MKIKYLIAPLVAFLFIAASFNSALAQEEAAQESEEVTTQGSSTAVSLGYAPVSKELKINPGDSYTGKITVWNLSDEEIEYFITVRGFKQIEEFPGTAVLLSEEQDMVSNISASKWFHFETESIVVPSQYNFELNYIIKVPADVTSGEYYAQVFFYTDQEVAAQESVVTVNNLGGGPTFLIKTGDNFTENMEILEFKSLQKMYETPDLAFSTSISNTGNTHLKPKGIVVLTNMFGQELGTIDFNPNGQAIIRDTLATYVTEWKSNYLFTDSGKLAFGPVTAELTVNYKSDTPGYYPVTAETTFWILQWKLALAVLGAIVALVWVTKTLKKGKKGEVKKNDEKRTE